MNWLTKFVKPIIKKLPGGKKSLDICENAWIKCNQCQTMLYAEDLEKTIYVCPNCDDHIKIHPRIRLSGLLQGLVQEERGGYLGEQAIYLLNLLLLGKRLKSLQ